MRTEWVAKRAGDEVRRSCVTHVRNHHRGDDVCRPAGEPRAGARPIRDSPSRLIIPANVRHTNLEPTAIGIASKCKINSNIGNSAVTSNIEQELEKLRIRSSTARTP